MCQRFVIVKHGRVRMHRQLIQLVAIAVVLITAVTSVAADRSATFPIPIYPDVLVVPVKIAGAEHLCVLDSGATGYLFHTSLRRSLGDPFRRSRIRSADDELASAEVFNTPNARIGTIELSRDAQTACFDLSVSREAEGRDIEGIIGLPLFQSNIVQVDFDAHRLTIQSASTLPTKSWGQPIDVWHDDGQLPMIPITFGDGTSELCVVDTGYTGSVDLSLSLYRKLLKKQLLTTEGETETALLSGIRTSQEGRLQTVKVRDFEMHNISVSSGGTRSAVGLGCLRRFRVTFDLPHDRIYLAKGTSIDMPDRTAAIGIGLLKKNERVIVTSLDPGGPGETSGIAVSDELLSIAGESIAGKSIPEVGWLFREKADRNGKLDLVFRRDGTKRNVSVKIRD